MINEPLPRPEFDGHADDYETDLRASLPEFLSEGDYFCRYKVEAVVASQKGKNPQTILDFGCGIGLTLQLLSEYFPGAALWGYDVSPLSIEHARDRVPSAVLTSILSDLPVNCFDVLFIANVFHHIPRDARLSVMKMCHDLLKPGGRIYVFEHNPYNPITKCVFERCSFDHGAEMISKNTMLALAKQADLFVVDKKYTLFFPKQLAVFRFLESGLHWLPIGAQYYVELAK